MKPILTYLGSKSQELNIIKNLIPEFSGRYIEPFIGGGAVFFDLERKSIINDNNYKLIKFYKEFSQNYDFVLKEITDFKEKYSKLEIKEKSELYYKIRNDFNNDILHYNYATTYYILNKLGFSGLIRYNSKGQSNVAFAKNRNIPLKNLSIEHRNLLLNTEIYNKDFEEILDMSEKDDFIFLDPPYLVENSRYSNLIFDEKDYTRLYNKFKNLKCKSLMIVGKEDFIYDIFKDYISEEYNNNYKFSLHNKKNFEKIHLIIKNY